MLYIQFFLFPFLYSRLCDTLFFWTAASLFPTRTSPNVAATNPRLPFDFSKSPSPPLFPSPPVHFPWSMAPIPLKRSASSAQSLTRGGAPEACGLVREAVRASAAASLASPPLVPTRPQPQPQKQTDRVQAEVRFGPPVEGLALDAAPAPGVLCWEEIDGRRWSYVVDVDGTPGRARRGSSVRAVPMQSPVAPLEVRSLSTASGSGNWIPGEIVVFFSPFSFVA